MDIHYAPFPRVSDKEMALRAPRAGTDSNKHFRCLTRKITVLFSAGVNVEFDGKVVFEYLIASIKIFTCKQD